MGDGCKVGSSGIFKSILRITANPGETVTATLATDSRVTMSAVVDSGGIVSFVIKKKGTYAIASTDGAEGSADVLRSNRTYDVTVAWNASITVQANTSVTVTATLSTDSTVKYTASSNGTTGKAAITIKKAGVYTITTDAGGSYMADGNVTSVNVSTNGGSYTAQLVKMNMPSSLGLANYSTGALTAYWTNPSSLYSGINLRRNTGSAPASRSAGTNVYTGTGGSVVLSTSSTVNGYTNTGLSSGTTYYYSAFPYITINGTSYYSSSKITASKAAVSYTGTIQKKTANGSFTVPEGWRKMTIVVIGAGGGAGSGNLQGYSSASYGETQSVGGSGGGGYMNTATINVTPGEVFNHVIGNGGYRGYFTNTNDRSTSWGTYSPYMSSPIAGTAGERTYVRKSGASSDTVSANGGNAGGNAGEGSSGYTTSPNGGSGGSGGGGGVRARTSSATTTSGSGGRNGAGGSAGVYNGSNVSSGGKGDGKTKIFNSVEHAGGGAGAASRWGQTSDADKYGTAGTCGGGASVGNAGADNTGAGGGAAAGGYARTARSGGSGVAYYQCVA